MTQTCPICRGARFIDKFDSKMSAGYIEPVAHERMACFMCNRDGQAADNDGKVWGAILCACVRNECGHAGCPRSN